MIDAVPGSPTANSYETAAEFTAYLATKPGAVAPPPDQIEALLISATRLLDNTLAGPPDLGLAFVQGIEVVYAWTGTAATDAQQLAWGRNGMRSANNKPIPPDVVPQGVKDCVSEIALAQAAGKDLTATNDTAVQGIASVSASSVSVAFKDTPASQQPADVRVRQSVLPDAAWLCLVPSWYQWNVKGEIAKQGSGAFPAGALGFDFAVT